jgi:hypothetical protein
MDSAAKDGATFNILPNTFQNAVRWLVLACKLRKGRFIGDHRTLLELGPHGRDENGSKAATPCGEPAHIILSIVCR